MNKTIKIISASVFALALITGCGKACPTVTCDCPAAAAAAAVAPEAKPQDMPNTEEDAAVKDNTPVEAGAESIALPKVQALDVSLFKSLEQRRSVRAYTGALISAQDLSNMLWAANGINREDGKRTAPSAMNKQSVTIYVAFEKGTYVYDFKGHKLSRVSEKDLRVSKESPLELMFMSNLEGRTEDTTPEGKEFVAVMRGIDAGTASQNAALYCAAAGLATVIRMYHHDEEKNPIIAELKLTDKEKLLFNMPVGFEKK